MVKENNRSLYRSVLFHFQRNMPELVEIAGEDKLHPAFIQYSKDHGFDYRYISTESFVAAVTDMLSNSTIIISGDVPQCYSTVNDYVSTNWYEYVMNCDHLSA